MHLLEEAQGFKSQLPSHVPVISVSLHDPKLANQAIKDGKCDMVSLGRQMLCDPEWANKVREGKKFRKCARCCDCLMLTSAGIPVRCRLNPELGREKYNMDYWRPNRAKGEKVIPPVPKF